MNTNPNQTYKEGLHILVQAKDCNENSLIDMNAVCILLENSISKLGLVKTGIVPHKFDNGAYTLIIGLTESHLSVHTWPEFGVCNYDIYLSNQDQVNDGKVKAIHEELMKFFTPASITLNEIKR